jgi:RimJ/RimL family protein N-acetyltransferase
MHCVMTDQASTPDSSNTFAPQSVVLRDGTSVQLRFLQAEDAERLQAFFYRLSPESIFYRLLEYRSALTDEEARALCDVDGQNRVAIAATVAAEDQEDQEAIVAVARYGVIEAESPDTAESAIVVQDDFQGRGLGTILIRRLVGYARSHGIRQLVATIHYNNAQILRFIERSGLRVERKMNKGIWDFFIYLDPPAPHNGQNA